MPIQKLSLAPPIPLFYKGKFDMAPIYRSCIEWMKQNEVKYIYETFYKEKEIGPLIVDKEIRLEGTVKLDEFRQWNIKITVFGFDVKTLDEIAPSGDHYYEGRLKIEFAGELVIDYQDAFQSESTLVRSMKVLIQKVWFRGNPGTEMGMMAIKFQTLATKCKQILGVEVL